MYFEAVILASSLSLDAFVASFAYGSKNITVPFKSVQIINFICSGITGLSFLAGGLLRQYIPCQLTAIVSFIILFLLGVIKLLDSTTKSIIRKYNYLHKEIAFSLFNFKFILNLYANPENADIDNSKTISSMEAASLAAALSLDGITVGLGAALGNISGLAVFFFSLVTNMAAILLGGLAGRKMVKKTPFNLSWVSGLILIVLAFMKIS